MTSDSLKRLLIITGTPGTGKSTIAKMLVTQMGILRIDLHELIENDSVLSSHFNKNKDCFDLDMRRVEELVQKKLQENPGKCMVLDSHVSHHLSKKLICAAIVVHCSDFGKLEKRLKERGYSPAKVQENLDCEIFDVCSDETQGIGVNILHFDSENEFDEEDVVARVKQLLSASTSF